MDGLLEYSIGESIKLVPEDLKMFLLLDQQRGVKRFIDMLVDVGIRGLVISVKEEQLGNAGFIIKGIFIYDKRAEIEGQFGFILLDDQYRIAVECFFFDFSVHREADKSLFEFDYVVLIPRLDKSFVFEYIDILDRGHDVVGDKAQRFEKLCKFSPGIVFSSILTCTNSR